MNQHLRGILTGVIGIAVGYYLASAGVSGTDKAVLDENVSFAPCETQDITACFGSGRELLTETKNTNVWNLVSTEELIRFGIEEKATGELTELIIQ